jgi:hypothetical protein
VVASGVVNCAIMVGHGVELFSFLGTAHKPFEAAMMPSQKLVMG